MGGRVHGAPERRKKRTAWRGRYDHVDEYVCQHIFGWLVGTICLLGCGYQALSALRAHLEYPSVVSSTYFKEAADFPGVTVCPENWYNISQVCRYWPKNCTRKDVMQLYQVPKAVAQSIFRFYGQPKLRNLFRCRMLSHSEICRSFDCAKFMSRAYFKLPVRYCFAFDANQLPKKHEFHACPTPWLYELQIEQHWNQTQMHSFLGVGSIPVYVHQARTNPPVGIEAISMFKNLIVEASMTQQTTARLPHPFQTQCEAYENGPFRRSWGGYQTHAGCIQECQMRIEQQVCNCTLSHHEYSAVYAERLCSYQVQKQCTDALKIDGTIDKCEDDCRLGCLQTTYDIRLSGLSRHAQDHPKLHRASLYLSFASSSVEHFQYSQALASEVTIGYISGYLGVWIGVSFHGVFQVILERAQKWCCC